MATVTTQIFIGGSHPNDQGVLPTHSLFLWEGDSPAWQLQSIELGSANSIIWVPTIENLLEDAILMINLMVHKDPDLMSLAARLLSGSTMQKFHLYGVDPSARSELYKISRNSNAHYKMVVNLLNGSSCIRHLPKLESYSMELEVCFTHYTRFFNMWTNETEISGSLSTLKEENQ